MPKLRINGQEIEAPAGMNLVEAAKLIGVEIPVFCYHPKLSIAAQCRMCLVDVEKAPKLVPACQATVADGMVVTTNNERVKQAQAGVMEFLLLNHPVDCPICDQAGECTLQDYYMLYDLTGSRSSVPKVQKRKVQDIGGGVMLDSERCVVCTRCVRYYDEVVGEAQMGCFNRSDKVEVSIFPDEPLHGNYNGNAVDICPVGALTWQDFRFQCRSWLLTKTPSVCSGCARGCNTTVEHHDGKVFRLKPRENEAVNQCWMCDDGRGSYKFVNEGRILDPKVRRSDGLTFATWDGALAEAAERVNRVLAKSRDAAAIGVVLSPQATVEDNEAVVRFARDYLGVRIFYLGGKPEGEADSFLRLADKNPNTAGVRAAFGGEIFDAARLLEDMEAGRFAALIVMGGDLPVAATAIGRYAVAMRRLDTVVVLASNGSPIVDTATVVLPTPTYVEKDGTFINAQGMRQRLRRALPCMGRSLPEAKVIEKLATRMGFDYRPAEAAPAASEHPASGIL